MDDAKLREIINVIDNITFEAVSFGEGYQLTSQDIEKLSRLTEAFYDILHEIQKIKMDITALYSDMCAYVRKDEIEDIRAAIYGGLQ